jgi:sugar phosphate isomerase/epimerase
MLTTLDRRAFLAAALATPLVPSVARAAQANAAGAAPSVRRLRLTCNLYSFNAPLMAKTMRLEEAMDYCASLGFDAVDPTGYYFSTYPEPPSNAEIDRIKRHAFGLGLDIALTGVRNDFTVTDPGRVAQEIALVTRWLGVAARLGAPALRIFAGGSTTEPAPPGALDRAVSCIERVLPEAERQGVLLVMQHHNDAPKTADEVLAIRRRVASDWFGLNVDIGSLRTGDPYEETARLAPYAYAWQVKELIYRRQKEEPIDLPAMARIIRESGFGGYVAIETLGDGDPKVKLRRMYDAFRPLVG